MSSVTTVRIRTALRARRRSGGSQREGFRRPDPLRRDDLPPAEPRDGRAVRAQTRCSHLHHGHRHGTHLFRRPPPVQLTDTRQIRRSPSLLRGDEHHGIFQSNLPFLNPGELPAADVTDDDDVPDPECLPVNLERAIACCVPDPEVVAETGEFLVRPVSARPVGSRSTALPDASVGGPVSWGRPPRSLTANGGRILGVGRWDF